jgi:hypothetical protein
VEKDDGEAARRELADGTNGQGKRRHGR